nr:hypothetical protein [Marinobacter confluentis]
MQRKQFRLITAVLVVLAGWWHTPIHAELRPFTSQPANAVDLQQSGNLHMARSRTFPDTYQQIPAWIADQEPANAVALTGGEYWLFSEVRHDADVTSWVLNPHNSLINRIEARVYSEDGQVQTLKMGYQHDSEYMLHYGKRLELEPDTTYRVLMHFSSPYFSSHPEFDLMPETDYRRQVAIENAQLLSCGWLCSLPGDGGHHHLAGSGVDQWHSGLAPGLPAGPLLRVRFCRADYSGCADSARQGTGA